jgi:uncharacterized protein
MRLYSSKVAAIAADIVRKLITEGDIETDSPKEVERDVEGVLNEYVRLEHEVDAKTRELMDGRKLPPTEYGRVKKSVAEQKGHKIGDDAIDFLLDQIVEAFMFSNSVDEVFADDLTLRRKMVPVLRSHTEVDEDIDREARGRLKHLQEGTEAFAIEYQKTIEVLKRAKGVQ